MTEDEIRKIQASFASLQSNADELGLMFYERLFTTHPELRDLFPRDITPQARKLVQMLALMVNGLNRLEALLPAVKELARRHVDYGVKDEHYAAVGETLLWTLAQGLGPAFTDDLRSAWSTAFSMLSGVMIAVGREEVWQL
ncbi:globin family protein [Stappia sp. P2PMeth1]|uniref:globin family protein n=1 Tax=Stappia sp. P2PMeth1 TaxID=2003586 RepID=UPI00164622CC|nr:globin family protein [Stappia sp. P2PMeth1]